MTVRDTSREAFRELVARGGFAGHKAAIEAAIIKFGPQTRRELTETTGIEINAVCGAVNKLIKEWLLQDPRTEIGEKGANVHIVETYKETKPLDDLFGDNTPQQSNSAEARLFNMVPEIASRAGRDPEDCRKQIASLKKQYTTEKLLQALHQSRDADDPLMYARKVLSNAKKRQAKPDGRAAFLGKGD